MEDVWRRQGGGATQGENLGFRGNEPGCLGGVEETGFRSCWALSTVTFGGFLRLS